MNIDHSPINVNEASVFNLQFIHMCIYIGDLVGKQRYTNKKGEFKSAAVVEISHGSKMGNINSTTNSNQDPHSSSECPLYCLLKSPKNTWKCKQFKDIEKHCTGMCFQNCSNSHLLLKDISSEELESFI